MSYQEDKRELLKLKQGLIDESESEIHEEEKPVYELHGLKWIENFLYRNKIYVILAVFFAAVAVFLTVSLITRERGDMRVMVVTKDKDIAENVSFKTKEFETAFELYCPDYDDNGYVHVEVFNVDLSENPDATYMAANVTKITSEAIIGEAQLYILDKKAAEAVSSNDLSMFLNLSELYPDVDYIDGPFLQIKKSGFAVNAQYYEACPDDLYMVVKKVDENTKNRDIAEAAQKKALEVVDNIVNGNYSGWIDDQGHIYGITKAKEASVNEA